ncbi:FRG domain-containing protein [uncultured Fenollaria sp.]|uniref:FRG domain-containing protein n=1 Tax=uncultured Fenollaria sp. TaxID=1686315 RepID=UPI0025EC3B7F|nr:FRG domain-containing protein [uncultured Fenollaria sp.]
MTDYFEYFKKHYKESKYFDKSTIIINYTGNIKSSLVNTRIYSICDLEFFPSKNKKSSEFVESVVNNCNITLRDKVISNGWQVFYLFKELFQTLLTGDDGFNYFRGQSSDYPLLPGLLRDETQDIYKSDFEGNYRKLSYDFPDKLKYIDINDKINLYEREYALSLLQHYGFKTGLLDITRNPYIAMLFMFREIVKKYMEPTLYLFKIDEHEINNNSLFTEVRKSHLNERILAQKGAFLNFEKVWHDKKRIKKIPCVKIILKFDEKTYLDTLLKDKETINELFLNKPLITTDFYASIIKDINENINTVKTNCFRQINTEMLIKLKEYYYTKEDMFPDFENRIKYLLSEYSKNEIGYNDADNTKDKK